MENYIRKSDMEKSSWNTGKLVSNTTTEKSSWNTGKIVNDPVEAPSLVEKPQNISNSLHTCI